MSQTKRSKGQFMLSYCTGWIQTHDTLDLNAVAHKFSAEVKDVLESLRLMRKKGYRMVYIGKLVYRCLGQTDNVYDPKWQLDKAEDERWEKHLRALETMLNNHSEYRLSLNHTEAFYSDNKPLFLF